MARPKLGESDTERLHVKITADEIKAIDDWRYTNRVPSRSEAVRRLCKIALFVENEYEQIVDVAADGVVILGDHLSNNIDLYRKIADPSLTNATFTQREVLDVLDAVSDQTVEALDGIKGLHSMAVAIFNALVPFADAETINKAIEQSHLYIEEANRRVEQSLAQREETEENRYLSIAHFNETEAERQAYEELPDDEQDDYLARRIKALRDEEEADPEAFAQRYGIPKKFWEVDGWQEKLIGRAKKA